MTNEKLKLDCTGCGSSLFQTNSPQVYKCERCDTSFKISFDDDGISFEQIERKFKTVVEDVLDFREKLKANKLMLNCLICGNRIMQTDIHEVYNCLNCDLYYKATFESGQIKLIKPDQRIIDLFDYEQKLSKVEGNLLETKQKSIVHSGHGSIVFICCILMIFGLVWGYIIPNSVEMENKRKIARWEQRTQRLSPMVSSMMSPRIKRVYWEEHIWALALIPIGAGVMYLSYRKIDKRKRERDITITNLENVQYDLDEKISELNKLLGID